MARAGFDPRAGVVLWQKMGTVSQGGEFQWLSTHPAGETRIAEMRRNLPKVMPLYAQSKRTTADRLPPYTSNMKGLDPVR